ncbi:sulfotransferase family protein [Streptomyces sp. NPDC054796]
MPGAGATAATGAGSASEAAAAARPASPHTAFRPPQDPETDRLLRCPVFVISPVRSGSTLLRLLLNAHSQLHSPHELHVRRLEVGYSTKLAERSMEALGLDRGDLEHLLWDRVMHRELTRSGKRILVEKTPSNAFAYQRLAACWPDARFLFLLRHPASIATSWHEADPEKRNPEEAALDALRYMRAVERARKNLDGHTVRYEDLTEDPATVLQGICAYLGVDWEPGMLDYGSKTEGELHKGLGDWKEKIRAGKVQEGRSLPSPEEIPAPLREISAAWGYTGRKEGAKPRAKRKAHAEISQVWPREGRIRLVGALHGWRGGTQGAPGSSDSPGSSADAPWRLVLTPRGHEEKQLSYDVTLDGTHFDVDFPVADLLTEGPRPPVPAEWDVHLTTKTADGEARLRLGRHLDDIENKKKVMVFPAQTAGKRAGAALVRPYYTVKNNLSIECAPAADATATATASASDSEVPRTS